MKIGIDIRPLRDVMTGIGRYLSKLVESLTQNSEGNEYVLFYNNLKGGRPAGLPKNSSYKLASYRLPGKLLTGIWAYFNYPKIESFTGPVDVFHSPSFQVPPARGAARVFTIFDLIAIAYPDMAIPSAVRHFRPRIQYYVSRADIIVAISKATAKDVVNILNVPEEKVIVVYPGTTPMLKADSEIVDKLKKKYALEKDYLLFVSRLDPRKNLSRLFKAFELSGLSSDFDLVVAGPRGWRMEEMFQTWRSVKCRQQIKWLYYVTDEELSALYTGATFFVYPSLVEGFGLPILEAMSVGCPVLTSNISSMPEAAGDAALYVDPYDVASIAEGMMSLANGPGLRQKLAEQGLKQTGLFSWENAAREMIKVYGYAREIAKARKNLKP